jgi:hypothetical protein
MHDGERDDLVYNFVTLIASGSRGSGANGVARSWWTMSGRISAKRLLPQPEAAGYVGSARNFRRLVAEVKAEWRQGQTAATGPGCGHRVTTRSLTWSTIRSASRAIRRM